MIGIYSITSQSGRVYIGQAWKSSIKERWNKHRSTKEQYCRLLSNSFKKYGVDNHVFKIVHELPNDVSKEVINEYELLYWQLYSDAGFEMLNLMKPGNNSEHSEETKMKISQAGKGRKASQVQIESVRKRSIGNKYALGIKRSDEFKKASSERQKGKVLSKEHYEKIKTINVGRKQSIDEIERRRKSLIGKKRTPEQVAKISKGLINHPAFSKRVIQLSIEGHFINEFPSIAEAARFIGLCSNSIGNIVGKSNRTAGGFKWLFKSDYQAKNN